MTLKNLITQLEAAAEKVGWDAPVLAWLLTAPDAQPAQSLDVLSVTKAFPGIQGAPGGRQGIATLQIEPLKP